MSAFRRFELSQPPSSSLFYREAAFWRPRATSLFVDDEEEEHLGLALDILNPTPAAFDLPFPFLLPPLALLDSAAAANLRRFQERTETELFLESLSDRVSALELGFERALSSKIGGGRDRKYEWTTEIKGAKEDGVDKKYKWTAEVKGGEETNFKWTAELKAKGKDSPASRKYSFQVSSAPTRGKDGKDEAVEKTDKKVKKKVPGPTARVVEIQDEPNPGAIAIKKAFAKSSVNRSKGKRKELSPQDAALIIQMTFRVHLVRRAKVLRGLRDLAVAKAKLKEIRALFYNFSYRRRVANDAEEHQRFSEKIIVLLLTVDAIEGPDYMVRAAKKSMVNELEAMLEVVDPQPPGKLGSMKRRKFNLPDGGLISKEMSTGVAAVVQMLDQEDDGCN